MTAVAPPKNAAPATPAAPAPATPAAPVESKKAAETTTPAAPATDEKKSAPVVPALGEPEPDVPDLGDEADTLPAEGDAAESTDAKPAAYDFQPPEGAPAYREPVIDAYKAVLAKHKVDAAVGKDILDTMLPAIQADVDAQVKAQIEQKTNEWREQLLERHGEKAKDVMRLANRALGKAATPALVSFLRDSALAVNPDFIDMLAFFGQRITNDRSVQTTESAPKQELSAQEEAAADYERQLRAAMGEQRGQ